MTTDPFLRLLEQPDPERGTPALSSSTLDELIERTVLLGGTSDTAAQELGIVDEPTALRLLGRGHQLDVADRAALLPLQRGTGDALTASLRQVLPRKLALTHGICPLHLTGRRLTVVQKPNDDPMAAAASLEELGFALSMAVRALITTEALWARATEWVYGTPVPPRLMSVLSPTSIDVDLDLESADESGWSAVSTATPRAQPNPFTPSLDDSSGWRIPGPGEVVLPAHAASKDAPHLAIVSEGTLPDDAPLAVKERLRLLDVAAAAHRARRRQKVLWSVDDAIAELALCQTRDELLEVTLRFAYRRLHTASIFVRLSQGLTCFDVLDPLLEGHELKRFIIPVDESQVLGRAVSLSSPSLGPIDDNDPLCRLLGRKPRSVLVVPIMLGERAIGAIVGDNDEKPIPPTLLGELLRLQPALKRALTALVMSARRAAEPAGAGSPLPSGKGAGGAVDAVEPRVEPTVEPVVIAAPVDLPPAPIPTPTPTPAPTPTPTPIELPIAVAKTATPLPSAPGGALAVAPSPGAQAKEALLQATWRAWLAVPVDDGIAGLVRALEVAGEGANAAVVRLVTIGLPAMPALARAFPGSGSSGGSTVGMSDEGVSAVVRSKGLVESPFFDLLERVGPDRMAPIVVGALDDPDRRRRFAAAVAARRFLLAAAIPALGRRLLDAEPSIAATALDAMTHFKGTAACDAVCARLRDLCRRGHDHERRNAMRAVAALRDIEAVPVLLDLVGARPRELGEEARSALVELTRQDFGTAERRWRAWYTDHQREPRRRWLLQALAHRDLSLRIAAADDLAEDGTALLGYHPDDAPVDRAEALVRVCSALGEPVPS